MEDVDKLLRHMELHYSDWAIEYDMDCVRPLATGWKLDVVNAYAKARRQSPGFCKNDPKANNHNKISAEAWDKINSKRSAGPSGLVRAKESICGSCGVTFMAHRSTAKYCGDRCRKRANRNVTLSSPRTVPVGDCAEGGNFAISRPDISGDSDRLTVTRSAA